MNHHKLGKTILLFATYMSLSVQATIHAAPEITLPDNFSHIRDVEKKLPLLTKPFYTTSPQKMKDSLTVGGFPKPSKILSLAKDISTGEYGKYDSILIAHNGKLIFESYYGKGRGNLPHFQASASKGYTSLAVGRAIQMGYLSMDDLHKPVLQFLPEVDKKNLAKGINKITLHHTLSMRSGLRISSEKRRELKSMPEHIKGQKLAQAYFTHSTPITESSQVYHYQALDPHITMLVLDAVLPTTAKHFIKTQLLDPLGIHQYFWKDNISGFPEPAHSTSMTSRDMIKWGMLLRDGAWQGKQFISKAFLNQATSSVATPHSETFDYSDFRYGYYFWGTILNTENHSHNANFAWGGGGQYVIAIDALDVVIAITGRNGMNGIQTIELLEKYVLPSFEKPS